jgi:8-oxo-dGTP pyrophosphatase MutT (NUDIX family)
MYKVFVNDRPLFLTDKIGKETNFQLFLLESVDIPQLIGSMFRDKVKNAYLYHPDEKEILNKLKSKLKVTEAAGAMVYNGRGEVLFIHRNGKWDLPKGGIEKGEKRKAAAEREVEEETGVGPLKIIRKLPKTYHIFKRNNEYRLKITHWYEAKTKYNGALHAQIEEGIDQVAWLGADQLKLALANSYQNIKLLFEKVSVLES